MAILNLLSSITVKPPTGMWEPLLLLFSFITNYGWRVILFTVLLKLVLSPLDFFQRYKMKKNQRISEKLAPEIDRLKKQYANDPRGLQQEQMRLQRSMGFSYIASCLPMIITLVVFLTFFAGIRNLSQYEEFKQYYELYNTYSIEYTQLTGRTMTGDGSLVEGYDDEIFKGKIELWATENGVSVGGTSANDIAYKQYKNEYGSSFKAMVESQQQLKNYLKFFNENKIAPDNTLGYGDISGLLKNGTFDIDLLKNATGEDADKARNQVLTALSAKVGGYNLGKTAYANFGEISADYQKLEEGTKLNNSINALTAVAESLAADAAYIHFTNDNQSFMWIKSLWVADVPTTKAIRNFSSFRGSVSKYIDPSNNAGKLPTEIVSDLNSEETYNKVMLKIRQDDKLSGKNGYFILAIIAVGLAALSQFITTRQQKKSGQPQMQGNTMKFMMLLMPVMVGVFAITSTSAFGLYMITNSAMSLLINLACGGIISIIFKSKGRKEISDSGVVKYGRRDPNDHIEK